MRNVWRCRGRSRGVGRGEAGRLHHPFDVEALFADPLVIVEEGNSGGADWPQECIGEERDNLRERVDPGGHLAVVLENCGEEESLCNEEESELDDANEQEKD